MRKLFVLLILLVVVGWLGYSYVFQPYAAPFVEVTSTWSALNEEVENQSAFEPPPDSVLTDDQIARYQQVQEELRREVRGVWGETWGALRSAAQQVQAGEAQFNSAELAAVARQVRDGLVQVKQAQVSALNRQEFSVEEYAWVQREMYRSVGLSLPEGGVADVLRRVTSGGSQHLAEEMAEGVDPTEVPSANRERVQRHAEWLKEHADLAFLGL
ncbi:MAG: hypothetical protein GVY12_07745 [Bacteroidetes bacterium]|jgi:hypothetical protein|nr:hypothetical protein [Bacteroidota bacterium]